MGKGKMTIKERIHSMMCTGNSIQLYAKSEYWRGFLQAKGESKELGAAEVQALNEYCKSFIDR